MYDRIGEKIQTWAKMIFVVEAIASIIAGLVIMSESDELYGILTIICGPIVAWVSSWILYGFGTIIVKLCEIADDTKYLKLIYREATLKREEKGTDQSDKQKTKTENVESYAFKMQKAESLLETIQIDISCQEDEENPLTINQLYQILSYALEYANDDNMRKYLERIDNVIIKRILTCSPSDMRFVVRAYRSKLKEEINATKKQ